MGKAAARGLTPEGRDRLVKVLGMLASSFDGERASAALLANRLIEEAGLTWAAVIPEPRPTKAWLESIEFCSRNLDEMTGWETTFCISLRGFARPSAKQLKSLQAIVDRLRSLGCE